MTFLRRLIGPLRRSLQLRVVTSTVLLGILAVSLIGFNLFQSIANGLQDDRVSRAEVLDADELLLSSATKEVLSITRLDGEPVGHASHRGQRGPISVRLHAAYQAAKQALAA